MLSRPDQRVVLTDSIGVHDGCRANGRYYFTSVCGHVIEADLDERRVTETFRVCEKDGTPVIGWCRGLLVTDDSYYVGFTVLRKTLFSENVAWLKQQIKGVEGIRKTQIVKVDRGTRTIVDRFVFDTDELSSVFWFGFRPA
jgi:hypothetical protein